MLLKNWSPNFLSNIPYHLQLKNVLQKAIDEGRLSECNILPDPHCIGVKSYFQKDYATKAYNLLIKDGKICYSFGRGYSLIK